MKILVVGGSGKIGRSFNFKNTKKTYFKNKIKNGIKFDIIKNNINVILEKYEINRVILMSAISDPDICFKNKSYSKKINIIKTKKLIDTFINKNIYFIFFSSEYIFDGKKGNYSEKSRVIPNNLYGKQKSIVENYIRKKTKNFCIMRIGKTYGSNIYDKTLISNFLRELIKGKQTFQVAQDQIFNPLYVEDLKKILKIFLKREIKGTFNVGGHQKLSRLEIFNIIFKFLGKRINSKIRFKKVSLRDFPTLDNRPLNVSMNISKLQSKINFKMKTISNIALKMIKKNNVKSKIFKRR